MDSMLKESFNRRIQYVYSTILVKNEVKETVKMCVLDMQKLFNYSFSNYQQLLEKNNELSHQLTYYQSENMNLSNQIAKLKIDQELRPLSPNLFLPINSLTSELNNEVYQDTFNPDHIIKMLDDDEDLLSTSLKSENNVNEYVKMKIFKAPIFNIYKTLTNCMSKFYTSHIKSKRYDHFRVFEINNKDYGEFNIDIIQYKKDKQITLFIRDVKQPLNSFIRKFNVSINQNPPKKMSFYYVEKNS